MHGVLQPQHQQQQEQQHSGPLSRQASSARVFREGSAMIILRSGRAEGQSFSAVPSSSAPSTASEAAATSLQNVPPAAFLAPPAAASQADEDEEKDSCGVCFDEADFLCLRPCNHKMCVSCARELIKVHTSNPVPCPFCRALVCGFKEHVKGDR